MKGKNAIITILSVYPELAEPWINDETNSKLLYNPNARTYFKDCTIEDLLNASRSNLFKDFDINTIAPAFNCACTP